MLVVKELKDKKSDYWMQTRFSNLEEWKESYKSWDGVLTPEPNRNVPDGRAFKLHITGEKDRFFAVETKSIKA